MMKTRRTHLRNKLFALLDKEFGVGERGIIDVGSTGRRIGRLKRIEKDSFDEERLRELLGETFVRCTEQHEVFVVDKLYVLMELGQVDRNLVEECRIPGKISWAIVHKQMSSRDDDDDV